MKNELAIVFCVHHKPWLIMSTLITTLIQDYKDYDIYFIYQQGDGTNILHDSYKEYYALADDYGINPQLSPQDLRTIDVCQIAGKNIHQLYFENDHGLDSGVWYKFIKTGLWQKYDYIFFMGEGTLLTFETTITDTLNFIQSKNAHFITGSQEKRRMPKELMLSIYARGSQNNKMDVYHDRIEKDIFDIFCRDDTFKDIFDSWPSDFNVITENHVPDIWGHKGFWLRAANNFYPNFGKGYKPRINLSKFNKLFFWYNQLVSKVSVGLGNYFPKKKNANNKKDEFIYISGARVNLKELVNFEQNKQVKFHKANGPEWFGCCCNHLVSKEFLVRFSEKLEKYSIYEVLKLPFCAEALEHIWGAIPLWLGFDKWFFNGIHRVRKNFVTYRREDDQEGMVRYINRYYSGKINVNYDGDFIKLNKVGRNFSYLKEFLNEYYF